MIADWSEKKVTSYKSYKNAQFNKKLDKARNLISSVNDTSLKKEDKAILLAKIKDMFLCLTVTAT